MNRPFMDPSSQARYAEPPVYEALVEGVFPSNINVPDLIAAFRARFPNEQQLQQIQVVVGDAAGMGDLPPGIVTHRLFAPNNLSLVNLGPRIFSYNVLQQYPGYSIFRAHVATEFSTLFEHVSVRPQQVGLRYLNRLYVPRDTRTISDVVKMDFALNIKGVRVMQAGLNLSLETDDGMIAIVDMNLPLAGQGGLAFLNISIITVSDYSLEWLDRAHANARNIFDNMIADSVARQHGATFT